jgi:hypothetical protein
MASAESPTKLTLREAQQQAQANLALASSALTDAGARASQLGTYAVQGARAGQAAYGRVRDAYDRRQREQRQRREERREMYRDEGRQQQRAEDAAQLQLLRDRVDNLTQRLRLAQEATAEATAAAAAQGAEQTSAAQRAAATAAAAHTELEAALAGRESELAAAAAQAVKYQRLVQRLRKKLSRRKRSDDSPQYTVLRTA